MKVLKQLSYVKKEYGNVKVFHLKKEANSYLRHKEKQGFGLLVF